jgi:hypothetical protein
MEEHLVAALLAMTTPSAASKQLCRAVPDEAAPRSGQEMLLRALDAYLEACATDRPCMRRGGD